MSTDIEAPKDQHRLFSKDNLKGFAVVTLVLSLVSLVFNILSMPMNQPMPPNSPPSEHPGQNAPPVMALGNIWPLWGTLSIPSVTQLLLAVSIFIVVMSVTWMLIKKISDKRIIIPVLLLGILSIFLSSIIQGWEQGIVSTIGGSGEIYSDAITISSILDFISEFNSIQPSLSVHALTQPPGAVLSIYFLLQIFGSEAGIALGLAILCTIGSLIPLRSIFKRYFSEDIANYGTLLYVFLPAIQVYYLANVYAIVSTFAIITIYCYFSENIWVSMLGSIISIFLGTFISFLFLVIPLSLLIFEILSVWCATQTNLKVGAQKILKPISIGIVILMIYGLLYVALGFNYLEAFLYASSSENPSGFMLFSNPGEYFTTRVQDIWDIIIFLGPFLIFLCIDGLRMLREKDVSPDKKQLLILTLSAFLALGLLFLTGAPKKGETARICMFVLPFVLLPSLYNLQERKYSRRELLLLLGLVFGQAIILQTIGTWVW